MSVTGDAVLFAQGLSSALAAWQPWEWILLTGVLSAVGSAAAWGLARLRAGERRAELAALSPDERAARVLGEAVARCGTQLLPDQARELWATFGALPPEARSVLALAVSGLVFELDDIGLIGVGGKVLAIAHGFRAPATPAPGTAAPATEEEARTLLAGAIAAAGLALAPDAADEVRAIFEDAPGPCKAWLAVRIAALLRETAPRLDPNLGNMVVAVAREGRKHFAKNAPRPEPAGTP